MQLVEQHPLVLHTDWSRSWGGQEIRVLTELKELRRYGFRVGLIVPRESELAQRAQAEKIPVYPVEKFAKFNLWSWRDLITIIRTLKPAVINTHSSEDSWMAGIVARFYGVPFIIRTRHVLAPISSTFSYRFLPHIIFTCSAAIADQLTLEGISPDRLVVLSTGNDEARFRFSRYHRNSIRQYYSIADNDILVGNVAFCRHYKGLTFFLRTAAVMPDCFRFMLVGDGEELPRLKALANELGVSDRVIFAGHQEQPEHYLSAFDLFFFSSYEAEGISQSLVQSLLNGLPVLACPQASTNEVLGLVEDYRLVGYGDVTAASQALQELAMIPRRDPERMEKQHKTVADRYGTQAMIRSLLRTYQRFGVSVRNHASCDSHAAF
ncbi:MAG: glycosyltransferase family 4 protein [Desulfobulbus sp.]|nr:glycosyltransferase family 4 protein [Desulfobulbus sp.]